MLNSLLRNCITRSTSLNSDLSSVNKSENDLLAKTLVNPPLVLQYERHQVIASPLKYRVKNSAASLSTILVAWTYAYIENIKFSVSECFPENVIGFSYFTFDGCNYVLVRCYYYGILDYYYYIPLGPASATGYYYCKNSGSNAG